MCLRRTICVSQPHVMGGRDSARGDCICFDDLLNVDDGQSCSNLERKILGVLAIGGWEQDGLHACSGRADQLLFDPSNKDSSPVIARSGGTALAENSEIRATACASPAEGPSLGIAPAGQ